METKEQKIINAAFKLFHRHGYKKVTMSDVAEASGMSRPSLYASFENKEAIFSALVRMHMDNNNLELMRVLDKKKTLKDKMEAIFDIYIIQPAASIIDSENGLEMLLNSSSYAPVAVNEMYTQFENHLINVIKNEMPKKSKMSAADLSRIMMLATKGLKSSAENLPQLQRMIDGLITMAIATVGK